MTAIHTLRDTHDDSPPDQPFTLHSHEARLAVVGVGGGGGNAVAHMISSELDGIRYYSMNTDQQALQNVPSEYRLALGQGLTNGLGAGANPNLGYESAMESIEDIKAALVDADMVFITAGMGGGTGTGASPVIAKVAKEMGILTVGVVTRPFTRIEGHRRANYAEQGIQALKEHTDSLIVIPNDLLLPVLGKNASLLSAFREVNNVLFNAVGGIARMITNPGLINIDFADVCAVMSMQGNAKVGSGVGEGEDRARIAAEQAINSPLLEHRYVQGAKGIMVNIAGGLDVGLGEFNDVGEIVREIADEDATVIIGTSLDESLEGSLRVSVVAAGLPDAEPPMTSARPAADPVSRDTPREPRDMPSVAAREPMPSTAPRHAPSARPTEPQRKESSRVDYEHLDIPAFLRRDIG